jgi:hypothetical protein
MKLSSLFAFHVLVFAFLTLACPLQNENPLPARTDKTMDGTQAMPIKARNDASVSFNPADGVVIAYTATEIRAFPITDVRRPVETVGSIASEVHNAFPTTPCTVLFIPFSASVYSAIMSAGFAGTMKYYVTQATKIDNCNSLINMGLQSNDHIEFHAPVSGVVKFTTPKGTYTLCNR